MKKYWLFLTIGLSVLSVRSQILHITGKISDTTGQALPYANIMIQNLSNPKTEPVFKIAAEDGTFKFTLRNGRKFSVNVYYLGYEPARAVVDSTKKTWHLDIRLKPKPETLENITINIRMPVQVKEDSIIYVADSFRTGTERKLEDLIQKMPGMEITPEGELKIMGKKVNKILVENKTFFGGTAHMALENIPAGAVDALEAIENYNDIDFMRGLDDNDNFILNIKLKKDKKRFRFGQISAGTGLPRKYNLLTRIFYYSPRSQINFIGNISNTGQSPVTMRDIIRTQTINDQNQIQNTLKILQATQNLFNQNLYDLNQNTGAFQWHHDYKKWKFHVFGTGLCRKGYEHVTQTINRTENSFQETNVQNAVENNYPVLFNLYGQHKINAWDYTDFSFYFNRNENHYIKTVEGTWNTFDFHNDIHNKNRTYKSELLLTRYKKYSKKRIVKYHLAANFDRRQIIDNYQTNQIYSLIFLPVVPDSIYQIQSNLSTRKNEFLISSKFYYLLHPGFHIYLGAGLQAKRENFTSTDGQIINRQFHPFDTLKFGNAIQVDFQKITTTTRIKYTRQNRQLKLGVDGLVFLKPFDRLSYLLPFLEYRIKWKRSRKLQLKLKSRIMEPGAPQLAGKTYLNNFKILRKGSPGIKPAVKHQLQIIYQDASFKRSYEFYVSSSAGLILSPISERVFYDGPVIYLQSFNSGTPVKEFSEQIRGGYYFDKWNFFIKHRLIYRNGEIYKAQQQIPFQSFFHQYRIKISGQNDNHISWRITYSWQFADRYTGNRFSRFIRRQLSGAISYRPNKMWLLHTKFSWSTDIPSNTHFSESEAGISLKLPDKPWQFQLIAQNILQSGSREQLYYQNEDIYLVRTRLMPFYTMFVAEYRF